MRGGTRTIWSERLIVSLSLTSLGTFQTVLQRRRCPGAARSARALACPWGAGWTGGSEQNRVCVQPRSPFTRLGVWSGKARGLAVPPSPATGHSGFSGVAAVHGGGPGERGLR